jgi:hypothetical protein
MSKPHRHCHCHSHQQQQLQRQQQRRHSIMVANLMGGTNIPDTAGQLIKVENIKLTKM